MLEIRKQMERQVTDLRDERCAPRDQAIMPPDEVPDEAPGPGGYFPFRGIVIGSVLGAGVWLPIWLLA